MRANSSPNPAKPVPRGASERLLGLDLIRFFSFYAIVFFHWGVSLWAPLGYNYNPVSALRWAEVYGRFLSFSGFSVLLLSFFLFGYKGRNLKKQNLLLPLLFVFGGVWIATDNEFPYLWDIYPYLLVAFSAVVLLDRLQVRPWLVAVLSFILTSLPFWRLEGAIPLEAWVEQIMWGVCRNGAALGEWPLLPWIGFPLFGWATGRLASAQRERLADWSWVERMAWTALLALSATQFGNYYVTQLGDDFGCYMFRQEPWTFWAHQAWVLFFIRVSLLRYTNSFLVRSNFMHWISALQVNQRFFVVYFIHYPIGLGCARWLHARDLGLNGLAGNLGLLLVIGLTEIGGIVFGLAARHNRWSSGRQDGQRAT